MVKVKTVDGQELPSVDFNNQSDTGIPIVPLKCTAWYKVSGRLETTWQEEDRALQVEPRGELTGFLTIALSPKKGDRLLKVVLKYGPAPGDEFTFVRK